MKTLPLLLALGLACLAASASARPNIVLIIADDLAWDDLGAYGHPTIRTPRLDRLAREGMRFERAFVTASSCSPSRASLITGRHPHATDAEQLHWPLPAARKTFVENLRAAGYWTGAAGKWHLGPEVRDRFDEIREANPAGYMLRAGATGADATITTGGDSDLQSGCTDWVPLLRDRPRDRPFFLWLASLDPHRDYESGILERPHRPDEVVVPAHLPDTPLVRAELALYYDEVTRLDRFVGDVLDELDRQGVADDTLVLFLSDNGRAFPRDKTTIFDGGIRTPLLVRWPGRVDPGSVCGALVSSIDLAPGLLEAAGAEPLPTAQGTSFLPLLANPGLAIRDHVFASHNWHDYEARSRAVRTLDHKLIVHDLPDLPLTPPADVVRGVAFRELRRLRDADTLEPRHRQCFTAPRPAVELYDLRSDPGEFHNLADDPAHAPIRASLLAALAGWRETTRDLAPPRRTPDEFDRETGAPLPNRTRPRPSKAAMGLLQAP